MTDNQILTCENCGSTDKTVSKRLCGYDSDVNGTDKWETICDNCEHEHLMDI